MHSEVQTQPTFTCASSHLFFIDPFRRVDTGRAGGTNAAGNIWAYLSRFIRLLQRATRMRITRRRNQMAARTAADHTPAMNGDMPTKKAAPGKASDSVDDMTPGPRSRPRDISYSLGRCLKSPLSVRRTRSELRRRGSNPHSKSSERERGRRALTQTRSDRTRPSSLGGHRKSGEYLAS